MGHVIHPRKDYTVLSDWIHETFKLETICMVIPYAPRITLINKGVYSINTTLNQELKLFSQTPIFLRCAIL